jgi:peptidoglycan/xylan/chitin deacetylase (PgdA/CDA1 family)
LAAAALAAGLIALTAWLLGGCGGGGSQSRAAPPSRPAAPSGTASRFQLEAVRPRQRVPLPRRVVGGGPFLAVSGRVVHRLWPAHSAGLVALTFDDGPGPQTAAFLRELKRLRVKATFFLVGVQVEQRPRLVRRLRRAGMELGNHTFSHPNLSKLGPALQRLQLFAGEDAVAHAAGVRPLFFRPPDWSWNFVTMREAAAQGMVGVLFTVDTQDWERPGVDSIVRRALSAGPGGIIGLHDAGGNRTQTLRALPLIVRGLRRRGLEPVTLDRLYGR